MIGYYLLSEGKFLSNYNFESKKYPYLAFVDNPRLAHSFSFKKDVAEFVSTVRSIPRLAKTPLVLISCKEIPLDVLFLDGDDCGKKK